VNGVFELFSGRANAFEERDITALQRLSDMIQTAIQHSEASERAGQELAASGDDVLAEECEDVAPQSHVQSTEEILESTSGEQVERATPVADETVAQPKVRPAAPILQNEVPVVGANEPPAVSEEPLAAGLGQIKLCESCGFPISESRTLCLDCESHQVGGGEGDAISQYPNERSWIASNKYLIGIVLMVVATAIVLLYFR
jgi:hypothetical protein